MNILHINIFDYKLIKPNKIYKKENDNYKLYAIVSCEKMFFKEPECRDGKLYVKFKDNNGNCFEAELEIEDSNNLKTLCVKSEFPCELMSINEMSFSASEIYLTSNCFDRKLLIEYIGLSTKNSETRLCHHQTLQKIQSDYLSNHINRDLYIVLFNAVHFEIKIMGSNEINKRMFTDEEIINFLNNSYEDADVINALAEAILINLFKPKYNVEYKNTNIFYNFKPLKNLYEYGYTEGSINLSLMERDRKNETIIYTDELSVKFSDKNCFTVSKICPFVLTDKINKATLKTD